MNYIEKLDLLKRWLHLQIDMRHSRRMMLQIFEETGYLVEVRFSPRFETFEEFYNFCKPEHTK